MSTDFKWKHEYKKQNTACACHSEMYCKLSLLQNNKYYVLKFYVFRPSKGKHNSVWKAVSDGSIIGETQSP